MASATTCPACEAPLAPTQINTSEPVRCGACNHRVQTILFPALWRTITKGPDGQRRLDHSEASCFYHPEKRAAIVCEGCGRFLCSLCDIELDGHHLCSGCIEAGKRKGELDRIDSTRTLYDEVALTLALLPVLFWPVTLVTAPTTIVLVCLWWKKPLSIIPRTRTRFVLALLFAGLQIAGWTTLFVAVVTQG